ncbi:MAG TPA: BON domain-containing protein [Candidatus Binataceae bacterium]|nr:BON domain-containing protein [Candidatus Binataceae bacterium]
MVNRNFDPEFRPFATRSNWLIVSAMVLAVILISGLLLSPLSSFAQPPSGSPRWVMQTRVQEALGGDPRFKNVSVTVTQPGTVILEGNVFDRKAFDAAAQIASSVQGVTRVINALTTTSFDWKKTQLRINQMLLNNGLGSVTATVIGNQVFLNGTVNSDADKQRAVSIVQNTAPDTTLGSNIIAVVPNGLF